MTINERHIHDYVDERYVERGKDYCKQGLVHLDNISTANIAAKCVGSRIYSVYLKLHQGRILGECNCPAFDDYGPCKHIAAVAFAVIARQKGKYSPSPACIERLKIHQRLMDHLNALPKPELVNILVNFIDDDEEFLLMLVDDNEFERI